MSPRSLWRNLALLDDALESGCGLVFDYDGTLTPMYKKPHDARLKPKTRALLVALAERAPVAVLTGRPVADAQAFLHDVPLTAIVGNHGAEWSAHRASSRKRISRAIRDRVLAFGRSEPGVVVEDKNGFGLSIHWRQVPKSRWPEIARFCATLDGVQVLPGHKVFNVLPIGAPDKGTALSPLRRVLKRPRLLFIGDDVTDERAFALGLPWLLSVRVGLQRHSAAMLYLREQGEVDRLLEYLLRQRLGPHAR